MNREALVTGGAGFIGSHLTEALLKDGWQVTIIDDLSTGRLELIPKAARLIEASIEDEKALAEATRGIDVVFHLAALPRIQPSFEDPLSHELTNVVGAIKVFEAARQSKSVKKIVYSASSACYGTPTEFPTPETAQIAPLSPYAVQKYSAEQHLLQLGERHGLPVIALRYFNVYGPRSFNPKNQFNAYSSVVGIFAYQKRHQKSLTVTGKGDQQRDFVHVRDVARANMLAATSSKNYGVYNVGCGTTISILDLAKKFQHPIDFIAERQGEAEITLANIDRIRQDLDWTPHVALDTGIAELLAGGEV